MTIFISLFSFNAGQEVFVTASTCYLYTAPSFESEIVLDNEEKVTLIHGDKLIVISQSDEFIEVKLSKNEQISGYVYEYYVTDNISQKVYPVFNCSVRNDNTIIYDFEKEPTTYTASSGQRVYIYNGFDDQKGFTSVQVVLPDGSLYNGYIKSDDLKPDGINRLVIVGLPIIAACVTIILSIIFLKKKKTDKKKEKKGK